MKYPPVPSDALRSNRLPSEREVAQTYLAIQEEEHELGEREEEIARVDGDASRSEQLMVEWAASKRRIEERRSWLSPIRRLPLEILDAIFINLCLSADYSLQVADSGRHITSYPLTLSQVSVYWRSVILSRPALWSSISVDVYHLERDISSLLAVYLANAKHNHLRLQIIDPNQDNSANYAEFENPLVYLGRNGYTAFLILLHQIPRCQELHLMVDSDTLNGIKTDFGPHVSFPFLRSFHDNTITWNVRPESVWFWESIRNAPMLTKLSTGSATILHTFPCHQLTAVSFAEITMAQLGEFLSLSRNLRSLTVHILNHDQRSAFSQTVANAELPHLETMSFSHCHSLNSLRVLFNSITAPSLARLMLMEDGRSIQECWDVTTFLSLLTRSSCPLRELVINFWGSLLPPERMAEILQLSPALVSLVIMVNRDVVHETPCFNLFMTAILEQLVIEPEKPILVPRLSWLHLEGNSGGRPPILTLEMVDLVVRMTQSRSKAARGMTGFVSRLDSLRLSFDTKVHAVALEPTMAELRVLESEGTHMEWST